MLVQRIGASDGSNPPPPGGGGTPPEEGPGGEPGGEPGEGNDPLGGDTTEPGNGYNNNVVGGCQAGGAPSLASLLLAMAAAGLARRRTARKSR